MGTLDPAVMAGYLFGLVVFIVAPLVVGIMLLVRGGRVRREARAAHHWWQTQGAQEGHPPPPMKPGAGTGQQVAGGIFLGIACLALLGQCGAAVM